MTAAPNPQKLLILAGIGIAAYWFASRTARAGTAVAAQPAAGQGISNPYRSATSDLLRGVSSMLGFAASQPSTTGRGGYTNPDTGQTVNNPSAYIASSAVDGVAINPFNQSAFDAMAYGFDGSNGAYWN